LSIASIFSDGGSVQVVESPSISRARGVTWAESETGSGVHQSVVSIPPYEEIYGIHPRSFNFGANGEILIGTDSSPKQLAVSTVGQQQVQVAQPLPQQALPKVLQQTHVPLSVAPPPQPGQQHLPSPPQQQGQHAYTAGGTLPALTQANLEASHLKDGSASGSPGVTGTRTQDNPGARTQVVVQRGTDIGEDSDCDSVDEESDDPDESGCFWFECRESICHAA